MPPHTHIHFNMHSSSPLHLCYLISTCHSTFTTPENLIKQIKINMRSNPPSSHSKEYGGIWFLFALIFPVSDTTKNMIHGLHGLSLFRHKRPTLFIPSLLNWCECSKLNSSDFHLWLNGILQNPPRLNSSVCSLSLYYNIASVSNRKLKKARLMMSIFWGAKGPQISGVHLPGVTDKPEVYWVASE